MAKYFTDKNYMCIFFFSREKILSNVDDEDKISELDLRTQLNQVQQTAIHLSVQVKYINL